MEKGIVVAPLLRRKCHAVKVGDITMGGGVPVVVQSMTDTDTADVARTVGQIKQLADAGSEVVRITVNTEDAAKAVAPICDQLRQAGYDVPIVGDFHYIGHQLLAKYPSCAQSLAKYRINPGNVGFGRKKDAQYASMIEIALKHDKPVRIGVNWGSLDQALLKQMMDENAGQEQPKSAKEVMHAALVRSALSSAQRALELGMKKDRIILSCKVSEVQDLISVYHLLASECDYALHLGLTEAGMGYKGVIASSVALGVLLQSGIGDTIRVSLTPAPKQPRTDEVIVAQNILQSLGIRAFSPAITACPGCGRTTSTFFRELTATVQSYVRKKMPQWKKHYVGVESMTVAVMGCVVNGPGESKHANIGISLPGTGETPVAPVFIDGEKVTTLRGEGIADEFKCLIDAYVSKHYG